MLDYWKRATLPGHRPEASASLRRRGLWLASASGLVTAGISTWFPTRLDTRHEAGREVAIPLPPAMGTSALLLPAPDPTLVENSPDGPMPVIGKDGNQAWQAYARPFNRNDKRPRLASVITSLGLNRKLTQPAMDRLPGAVTLAFSPYTADVKEEMHQARSLGHETLMGLPMEPLDYPRDDRAPLKLRASISPSQNIDRLDHVMGKTSGCVGLLANDGGRFTSVKMALIPILENLKQRGLMFVDDEPPNQNLPASLPSDMNLSWAAATRFIDIGADLADPVAIDRTLTRLEATAQRTGTALGVAVLSPVAADRSATWVATLAATGFTLAPISAIVTRQVIDAAAAR